MNRTISFFSGRRGAHRSRLNQDCEGPAGSRRPNGFTLMELLIVMAIIAILMLIAIPTVGSLKKNANRLSAIQSIRAVQQAEMQYSSTYPANGYACTLAALGGETSAGPPSVTAAQILQGDITSGYKSGYIISISNCQKVTVNGTDRNNSYTVTAVPQTVGKTGDIGFCSDDGGPIKSDPTGGTNCTQLVQ
ncbi:MAG: prepilin-type N-terminal cleavage/methylation domain-containing protein [Terracidiphilus sp.]